MTPRRPEAEQGPERTLVVDCPDWPVVAAGVGADEPAAVVFANKVVACSAAARAEGVTLGLRRRLASARCPALTVLAADPTRDAVAFEVVAAAVSAVAPRLEVVAPGVLALATRGPSRYFGGDEALAARVAGDADAALQGRARVRVGVADGLFAALLAARAGTVVAPGASSAFLAPHPTAALASAPDWPTGPDGALALVELFGRLGLRTLGDVAALRPADLVGRFGPEGARAARLVAGLDPRAPLPRTVAPDLAVAVELDPPAEQVETAAFLARTLAAELGERLAARGLACTRVSVEAETEHGEALARLWRSEGGLGPAAMADRVRWQLDGWLNGPLAARPTSGITLLRLVPDQVVADDGRQLGFWGGATAGDDRAARGIARLQGLLGPDAVGVPERRGGRGPGEQVGLVPAHTVRLGAEALAHSAQPGSGPWPGRLPAPSPADVAPEPAPARVVDAAGEAVGVTGRGFVTAPPHRVSVGGAPEAEVVAWCGPWTAEERWWDAATARRRARLQVVTRAGAAHLFTLEAGRWSVEATYD